MTHVTGAQRFLPRGFGIGGGVCALSAGRARFRWRDLALIVQENRRYARRQLIWFRKEPNLRWFDGPGESGDVLERVERALSAIAGSQA